MIGSLKIEFYPDTRYGAKRIAFTIDVDDRTCREFMDTKPPSTIPGVESFDSVVEKLKRKEFRRNFFIRKCTRIGTILADYMEDAEGWHDISRIEPAKKRLGL